MDSSIKTDVRTGIFTKVRRIRQRPMQAKSPCRLSTCKRYASTEDISRMTTAKLTFLPKCRASSYALNGSLAGGANTLDLEMGCSSLLFSNPTYTLKNDLSLSSQKQVSARRTLQLDYLERCGIEGEQSAFHRRMALYATFRKTDTPVSIWIWD